jgi:hypothetical protein
MQNLFILVVLGFATARGVQLVVHDTIADPLRARLERWHVSTLVPGPDGSPRRLSAVLAFLRQLISCVYCVGFWLAVVAVAVYLTAAGQWGAAPLLVHCIEAWAVAGIAMMINRIDDTLPVRGGH